MAHLTPRRIVIGARAHAQLIDYLLERRPDLEFVGAPHTDISAENLAWGDTYVGFRRPRVPDWGSVRWVHCTGAGVDAFLFEDPLPESIELTRTLEPFGPQIAEFCVARALFFMQHLRLLELQQRDRIWKQRAIETLAGMRVVVLGTGEVGTAIASRFAAMGSVVDGISRSGRPNEAFRDVWPIAEITHHLAGAHWLVLAAPLTHDSYRVIDRSVLSACRGVTLINVGRGQLVEESAIPEALDKRWLRGAALDVFDVEPLPESSPLWSREEVLISPHVAGLTTIPGAADSFLESLASIERGERPSGLVDRSRGY